MQIYVDQNKSVLPIKGPDGSSSGANGFGKWSGPQTSGENNYGADRVRLSGSVVQRVPPLIGGSAYYDQILAYSSQGGVLPHAGGDSSIFICPLATPPSSFDVSEKIVTDTSGNNYFLLYGYDSTGKVKSPTGLFPNPVSSHSICHIRSIPSSPAQ